MPDANSPEGLSEAASPDAGNSVPRISMREQGFIGLRTSNRHILEEHQQAFRYPAIIRTINEMRNNPTVGAALNVHRSLMTRVRWSVVPPTGASKKAKERARLVATMQNDMTHSWDDFISTVIPFLEYGFAINEIVLRRRLKRNGSKYNDGLIGIKKLATRNQETVWGWRFNDDHSEIVAVQQTVKNMENNIVYMDRLNDQGFIEIERDKFLLFTTGATKGNPEGNSIFKNIYLAYKQLTLLQENQLTGVAKDVQGILKIAIPPQYMSPDASDEDKATLKAFQNIIDNYNAGTQRGLLVPLMIDPDSKLPLFTYELMETKGNSKYDTESIIRGYQQDILTALNVDVLKLGATGGGSFSLAEAKTSILALAIDNKLKEIQNVLNHHLMRKIYEVNGWDMEEMASFVYSDVEDIDLADFGAAIQRIFSVGAIELDREVMNKIRKVLGISELGEDVPIDTEKLSTSIIGKSTNAGEGMEPGTTGNGTAKIGGKNSKKDASVSNKGNAP